MDKAGQELDQTRRDALLRALEVVSIVPTTHCSPLRVMQPAVRGMRLGGGAYGPGIFMKEIWLDQ